MTAWRPASGPEAAGRRADLLRRLRRYFRMQDVLEVDTPALSPYAVSDIHIESLAVTSTLSQAPLYLQTSPEFPMKRLLAAGYPDIYSICRVFRDGESGTRHQPEFTMVEWYRLDFDLGDIVDDTTSLIAAALEHDPKVTVVNYYELLKRVTGVDGRRATPEELANAVDADDDLVESIGDARDDWLDLLIATRVQPALPRDEITVVVHYPASQAALARLCPTDASVADRFEVFLGPVELANGYVELVDAVEQSRRIERDQQYRKRRGLPVRPHDSDLLAALDNGLPACAGVALGLERLQMALENTDDIRDVITFGFGND